MIFKTLIMVLLFSYTALMATDDGEASEEVVVSSSKRLKLGHEDEAEPVKNAGVTTLNLSHDETLTNIEFIKHFPCLTHLDLSENRQLTSIKAVCSLDNLQHLNLTGCEKIADFEEIRRLTTLRTLDLSYVFNSDEVTYPPTLDFLSSLVFLRKLDLRMNGWLFSIAALASLPELTSLNLSFCKDIKDWEFLSRFPALKKLKIKFVSTDFDLSFLTTLTSLESLYVTDRMKLPNIPKTIRIHISKIKAISV